MQADYAAKFRTGQRTVFYLYQETTRGSWSVPPCTHAPMADVCIDLEPAQGRGEGGARFFDCSKTGGVFAMEMMPPGKYLLVARHEVKVDLLKSKSTLTTQA
jgi:hypothetical protein